jgi:hypothetical protein
MTTVYNSLIKLTKGYFFVKKILVIILLIFTILVRFYVLWNYRWDSPNGDEAIAGLMAKHIAEGKNFPVFFYGQAYLGALEAYLTAPFYFIFGFDPNFIYIVPFFSILLLVYLGYKISRQINNPEGSWASVLIFALAPWFWLFGIENAGGFALATLLELLAILVFFELQRQKPHASHFFFFCFISGLLFWVWQIYIPVFVVLIIYWTVVIRPRLALTSIFGGIGLFILGSLPLWIYNITHQWMTFVETFGK